MPASQFASSTNLFPNRDYDQHEVLPFFALNATGLGGQFVTFLTGGQNPVLSEGLTTQNVLGGTTNVYSKLYGVNRQVRVAAAGDSKWEVAGLTLMTTAYYDENGMPLLGMPDSHTFARGFVKTGQAVPILKRGQVTVALSQFNGTKPVAGYPLIASGTNGGFACVTPSYVATAVIGGVTGVAGNYVVGRCISDTGMYNGVGTLGGFAQIEVSV